jgi:peptidoglycan hydrolase CwlO-like protein
MPSRHRPARNAAAVPASAEKPVDKFPQLRKAMADLQAEREKILAKSAPIREKRDKLRDKMAPMEAELRAHNQQIKELEQNRVFEIDNQIAALARGMGARSLSEATG